jgi:hypothetical protein
MRATADILFLRVLVAILCCLVASPAIAQTLQGKVKDAGTGEPLYPVTVVNLRTQKATYTTQQGDFTIHADKGDIISFTYIGYKPKEYNMPVSVGAYTTNISLQRISYQLQEVILMPGYNQYQVDSIERKRTYRAALSRRKSSPIGSPFSFVAEKFNKRSKQIFKFQRNFNQWEDEKYIDTRYTTDLVYEMTGLEGDSLGHFMNAYPMPYDYARTATDLEMKMWIRHHYREWLSVIDTAGLPKINEALVPEK